MSSKNKNGTLQERTSAGYKAVFLPIWINLKALILQLYITELWALAQRSGTKRIPKVVKDKIGDEIKFVQFITKTTKGTYSSKSGKICDSILDQLNSNDVKYAIYRYKLDFRRYIDSRITTPKLRSPAEIATFLNQDVLPLLVDPLIGTLRNLKKSTITLAHPFYKEVVIFYTEYPTENGGEDYDKWCHELVHAAQYKTLGFGTFCYRYAASIVFEQKHDDRPIEKEADYIEDIFGQCLEDSKTKSIGQRINAKGTKKIITLDDISLSSFHLCFYGFNEDVGKVYIHRTDSDGKRIGDTTSGDVREFDRSSAIFPSIDIELEPKYFKKGTSKFDFNFPLIVLEKERLPKNVVSDDTLHFVFKKKDDSCSTDINDDGLVKIEVKLIGAGPMPLSADMAKTYHIPIRSFPLQFKDFNPRVEKVNISKISGSTVPDKIVNKKTGEDSITVEKSHLPDSKSIKDSDTPHFAFTFRDNSSPPNDLVTIEVKLRGKGSTTLISADMAKTYDIPTYDIPTYNIPIRSFPLHFNDFNPLVDRVCIHKIDSSGNRTATATTKVDKPRGHNSIPVEKSHIPGGPNEGDTLHFVFRDNSLPPLATVKATLRGKGPKTISAAVPKIDYTSTSPFPLHFNDFNSQVDKVCIHKIDSKGKRTADIIVYKKTGENLITVEESDLRPIDPQVGDTLHFVFRKSSDPCSAAIDNNGFAIIYAKLTDLGGKKAITLSTAMPKTHDISTFSFPLHFNNLDPKVGQVCIHKIDSSGNRLDATIVKREKGKNLIIVKGADLPAGTGSGDTLHFVFRESDDPSSNDIGNTGLVTIKVKLNSKDPDEK